MSLWLLLVVGVAVGVALFALGGHMVRPAWGEAGTRADVGVAVITTTVISLAIFVLQILDENRLQREDAKRQDESANQALRLQLGLTPILKKMDLHDQDLQEINLPEKHLEDADLSGAHLEGANLEGAHLENASLSHAHLEGTNLKGAHLNGAKLDGARLDGAALDFADLSKADLFGAQLTNAELYAAGLGDAYALNANFKHATHDGWNIKGLQFDNRTVFPNGKTHSCRTAPCVWPPPKTSGGKRR